MDKVETVIKAMSNAFDTAQEIKELVEYKDNLEEISNKHLATIYSLVKDEDTLDKAWFAFLNDDGYDGVRTILRSYFKKVPKETEIAPYKRYSQMSFKLGDIVRYRSRNNPKKIYTCIFTEILTNSKDDLECVVFGSNWINVEDLAKNFEYLDDDIWVPMGIIN